MTIKQQGGIFGRNPTFNDVTIEGTLTTSGSQSYDELTIDNINLNSTLIQIDANNAGQTSALNRILFKDTDTSTEIGQPLGQIDFWNNDSQNGVAARIQGISEWTSGISGIAMYTGSGGSPALAETLRLTWDGQVKATRGNFRVESGYGLNFAATSDATGATSELFDDYEEGTWTATVKGSTSDPSSALTATGYYTKIGDTVTAWVRIQNGTSTGASGNASISGLPYTSNASVYAVNDVFCNQLNTASLLVQVDPSTTVIRLLQENGNAATWSSSGAGMYASVQVTYKV